MQSHCHQILSCLFLVSQANTDDSGTPSRRRLQNVINFYTQTILGVLLSATPSQTTVSTLIPAISTGLKSHDLPDHMTSSYMILGRLITQTNLELTVLERMLNIISKVNYALLSVEKTLEKSNSF